MKVTNIDKRWGRLHLLLDGESEVPVLRCVGRIVAGLETEALSAVVQSYFHRDLIIDLAGVSAMDAGGVGTLVALHRWAQHHGRHLLFVNPSDRVRAVIERTRLTWLLEPCCLPAGCIQPVEFQCTA